MDVQTCSRAFFFVKVVYDFGMSINLGNLIKDGNKKALESLVAELAVASVVLNPMLIESTY